MYISSSIVSCRKAVLTSICWISSLCSAAKANNILTEEVRGTAFTLRRRHGVENRKLEVAREISDGLNTWFAAEALREMSLSKEKWDPPLDVADPIEMVILERCYRRQLERHREDQEKEKEAATGDPALREEA